MVRSFRLMFKSKRLLTYVVLWSVFSSVCVYSQVSRKDFSIQLYEKNLLWVTCPEGWSKIRSTCVLVLAELATFTQAESLCQSYGGWLLKIEGYNQNQQLGYFIENVQHQQKDKLQSLQGREGASFWIGLSRDEAGQYSWTDGQVTNVEQGFWALDQPLGFQHGHKLCSSVNVFSVTDFGKYRWSLGPCEAKLPILCQTMPCAEQQYRCQDGSKCISSDWLCDGVADCLDQSDERNCSGYCGNRYQGNNGTFQSPYYPHPYPPLSSCQWNIHTPVGTRVYLRFEAFDIENGYDVVSIYDGRSTLDPLVGNYSGRLPTIPLASSNDLLVKFHADQDSQMAGFNATWFAVAVDGCGGHLNATAQNQWITSPGYRASQYMNNLICDWNITAQQNLISLQFEDVSLGAGDWIEVRDGDSENSALIGRYTGETLPPVIISTDHSLFVRFLSDREKVGRGFNISYKAGCNDILVNKEAAIISSPGYKLGASVTYPSNLRCSWLIHNPRGRELTIVFDDNFDTEVDFDVLTIINGSSTEEADAVMYRYSGTKTPAVQHSHQGHFIIHFTSDDLVSRPGWGATISYDCPKLENLSNNLNVSSLNVDYGTFVKFTCDTGYLLEGAATLVCDINGSWSDSLPTCKKINCGSPVVPESGGIVSSNSSYYTGIVKYRCDVGYRSRGEMVSRCQRNGQWSSVPVCEKIRCPKLDILQNGSIINDFDPSYGQKVYFRCKENFRLINASEIICEEDGEWSSLKPHCAPPLCPHLPIINGNTNVVQPVGGSSVQVSCNAGYYLEGSRSVPCNWDGTYPSNLSSCKDIDECEDRKLCQPHMCRNVMGSYQCLCSHGYQKLNETSNTCHDIDECEIDETCDHTCRNTDGSYVCECRSGYKLYRGNEVIVVDQRTIIPNKTCIVTCPAFNVSNGGKIYANTTMLSDHSYIHPTALFIYCPYGTLPLWNSTTVFCRANGTWSHDIDHCTDQVCETLPVLQNGYVSYDNDVLKLGTVATYNCSNGYSLYGSSQRQCVLSSNSTTFWSEDAAVCLPKMCVEPIKPFRGYVNYTGLSYGSVATYSCRCGYHLIGSKVRNCQGNGVWSGNSTICVEMECSTPAAPSNGGVYSQTRMFYYGSRVSYTCQKGHSLIGSAQSTCALPEETSVPDLLLLLKVKFKGDNNINMQCAPKYGEVLAAKFNMSIRNLPACSSVHMHVLDSSTGNFSGTEIILGTSITLSGSTSAVCSCSANIIQNSPTRISWTIQVNSCPTLANKDAETPEKKFLERISHWKCPVDFSLQGGEEGCDYTLAPVCRKVTALPPLHYGTYWTYRYPANSDTSCQQELETRYVAAFEDSRSVIQNAKNSQKASICPSALTLSVTYERPHIINPEQEFIFILKIAFMGDKQNAERCAGSINSTVNNKVEKLFNEINNNPTCSAIYPPTSRTLSKRSEWMCVSDLYDYDINQHLCVLSVPSAASHLHVASSLSDNQPEVLIQTVPRLEPPTTTLQPTVFPTSIIATNVPSSTSTETQTMTPTPEIFVEQDETPFFITEVNLTFQSHGLTDECEERLEEDIRKTVNQASDIIKQSLGLFPSCLHITDAELIPTKSALSHSATTSLNQTTPTPNEILLMVPFVLRSRNFPLDDMENCINHSVKPFLAEGFQNNISYLISAIPGNICRQIDFVSSRYTVDIRCPTPFVFHHKARRCYRSPVIYMPIRVYKIQVTFFVSSARLSQCNVSYQRSIRRQLERQQVNILRERLYDMCLRHDTVVTIHKSISQLKYRENGLTTELIGNVSVLLMATSEEPDYPGCAGSNLHQHLWSTDFIPGALVLPTDNPRECGNVTWEKNDLVHMEKLCLESYLYYKSLNRCVDDRSAVLQALFSSNFTMMGAPNQTCLSNVRIQMLGYINTVIANVANSSQCSLMYKKVEAAIENDQVKITLNIMPYQWNSSRTKNCLKLIFLDVDKVKKQRFSHDLRPSCPDMQYRGLNLQRVNYQCIVQGYLWSNKSYSCVRQQESGKRKRRSSSRRHRGSQIMWTPTQLRGSNSLKNSGKPRQKRSMVQNASSEVLASWLPVTPECQDQQPPVFVSCPRNITVTMGRKSPEPFNFDVPQATDNSGVPPIMGYYPADIFRQPYLFREQQRFTITATDQSNNTATCSIPLLPVDSVPPDMTCPDTVVVEKYNTIYNQTNITISNVTSAWDLSGLFSSHVTYSRVSDQFSEGAVPLRHFVNVTATAYDVHGNKGSCDFLYEAKRADMNAEGNVVLNFTVNVADPRRNCTDNVSKLISYDVLNIANNSCIKNAEIYLGYILYGNVVSMDSLVLTLVVTQLKVHRQKFYQCMDDFMQGMVERYQSGSFFVSPDCGDVNVTLDANKTAITCPLDSVRNETSLTCVQCDLGYYADQTKHSCERCPSVASGVFISWDCQLCDSENRVSCLKTCQAGEYSVNGLQPCIKCPQGQYADQQGAMSCIPCPSNRSTEKSGAASSTQCRAICPPGQYSQTGLDTESGPCIDCPWNHYSSTQMSTDCTPCPQGNATESVGKSSLADCKVTDFCAKRPSPCQNGGTCLPNYTDNWYSCTCPTGYYGYHCELFYSVCDSEPCMNGGTCDVLSDRPVCHCPAGYSGDRCEFPLSPCRCVYGACRSSEAGYHCSCFEGFMGLSCGEDIDECSPNPCLHGGKCINLIGQYQCDCSRTGYRGVNCTELGPETTVTCFHGGIYMSGKCACVPGYTGSQCELGINECEDDFCGEHGDCIDGVHNFSCVCKPGFTGKDCTNNADECLADPCLNSARCIPGNNDFSCRCPPGFQGKRCEINRDECTPFPCNLTTAIDCIDGNNDYTCVCRSGWTGKWCEQRTTSCPFQCQNAGSCNISAGRCDCLPGYTGIYCEVALDECAGMPCLNGGTCTDLDNGFTCSCPQGFTNTTCNVNVDDCSSHPCRNGGTCYDLVNDFACSCPPEWTGANCEHKISYCLSLPCQNNGNCVDSTSGYYCVSCAYGYTGQNCSDEIITCESSPCENGASCADNYSGFVCNCTSGYTGKKCDVRVDPCLSHNACQNGATCQNGSCVCSPFFTGFDCGKEKSSDFDLFFHGLNGSSTTTSIPVEGEMSFCLWIRSFNTGQNKTILTLAINDTVLQKVLEIRENNFSVTAKERSNSWNLNNALWNHVCFTWTQVNLGAWSLFLNGSKVAGDNQMNLPNRVEILLGQPLQPVLGQVQFYGEVSQLQVFQNQLDPNNVSSLSKSCIPVPGTSRPWLELQANIQGDLEVNEPSICGGMRCPAGYKGHYCSIKIDKSPPVVTSCPSNFRVVSSNRLSLVNWTEPTFYDDVGVVNVIQTHRSGEVLAYGEYVIMYMAFDAANNTGNCTFHVAVTPFDCEVPAVPEGVNHNCQTMGSETYCRLSCDNPATRAFSESVPEFYRCGLSGQWDPPRGENFTFPACAAFFPPAAGVTGTISFAGPTCTEDLKLSLNQTFDQVMGKWNQEFKLCPDQVCNMQVQIHCSADVSQRKRRRRQAVDSSYLVRFNFPVDKTSLETTSLQPLDSIKTFVKKGEFNSNGFVAQNDSVILTTQCNCSNGQELKHAGTTEYCVNCAVGSFQNQLRSPGICELCPIGFYNDQEKQTQCTPCPPGKTSQDPGSTTLSQCYTICPAGQYAEDVTNVCKKCPRGYYQNSTGSRMCQSCPNGQMTLEDGATSEQSCRPGCLAGEELSVKGVCKSCNEGFYKGDSTQASCQPCPYGTTTPTTGSSSVDQCSIVVCAEGSYTSNNRCFLCDLGQYQPVRGQNKCLKCAQGQTTLLEGSRSPSDCVEGNVNECVTGVAECGKNEKCRDTPLFYECDCEEGYERRNRTCISNQHPLQQDDSTRVIIGATVGVGAVVIFIVIGICLSRSCSRKKEKEGLEHEGPLYRDMPVVVLPGGPAPVFQNRIYGSSRSSSVSIPGSEMMLTPVMSPFRWRQTYLETEEDMLPYFCPDESLNISDSSENGSSQGGRSTGSGFDVDSDSYF